MEAPRSIIEEVVRVATSRPEVRAMYLFGSHAMGTERSDSDVDLGVL
ncbi:MAG: nucleotidyltransferase domain-containing protein, partial [Acidobacteria bacterium]|nr:nucleotidyltransferase domain-containing protein [Acidobacteriota bacterium]